MPLTVLPLTSVMSGLAATKAVDLGLGVENEIRVGLLELVDHRVAQSPLRSWKSSHETYGSRLPAKLDGLGDVGIGRRHQIGTHLVQRAKADIPATGDVEGEQVGVDANEIVAHGVDDVEVHLLGLLGDRAGDDGVGAELLDSPAAARSQRQRSR